MVSTLEQMQVPNGTGPGVRRSKRPLLASRTRGVSTESQKRTSVLQIRRDFSPTRHMTRINVGLALSLVKLLLSSWKIYMCNLVTWYTNK